MEKMFFARVGALFGKKENFRFLLSSLLLCLTLSGCATSEVTRDASANIDLGVQNAQNMVDGTVNGDITDTYQNSNQRTKGLALGGAAGAILGATTPGIGIFPGAIAGAIIGGSYGAYIDSKTNLRDRLDNRGVSVVILGDQVLIMVPSARLFEYMTATVKPQAYSTLNMIAKYINRFTKITVKVSSYTARTGSKSIDIALSQEQANNVSKVLQACGIDARLLYAAGYGGQRLVVNNGLGWDESDNYRIEITLEKLYV